MLRRLCSFALLTLGVLVPSGVRAEDSAYVAPLDQLLQDTMRSDPSPGSVELVWWVPTDFWRSTFQNNPDVSASQGQKIVDALDPYAMFAVMQGKMGALGAVEFKEGPEVRASMSLKTASGATLRPLAEDKLSGDAALFAQLMRPMLVRMLGPTGEHLEFYFFDNSAVNGVRPVDARAGAAFSLQLGEQAFTWQLPLESLFAPVDCVKCGRQLKGTWTYCPYDGARVKK